MTFLNNFWEPVCHLAMKVFLLKGLFHCKDTCKWPLIRGTDQWNHVT